MRCGPPGKALSVIGSSDVAPPLIAAQPYLKNLHGGTLAVVQVDLGLSGSADPAPFADQGGVAEQTCPNGEEIELSHVGTGITAVEHQLADVVFRQNRVSQSCTRLFNANNESGSEDGFRSLIDVQWKPRHSRLGLDYV